MHTAPCGLHLGVDAPKNNKRDTDLFIISVHAAHVFTPRLDAVIEVNIDMGSRLHVQQGRTSSRRGACYRDGPPPAALHNSERDAMLRAAPSLRAFAISLCGNADRADDLVQETFVRALANIESFEPGTNMCAWLMTILRNAFFSQFRKQRIGLNYRLSHISEPTSMHPDQYGKLEVQELYRALLKVPKDQREALMLVGASGFSYGAAATACGCAIGTVKSRVNRARARVTELMAIEDTDSFGPDASDLAVLS